MTERKRKREEEKGSDPDRFFFSSIELGSETLALSLYSDIRNGLI